MRKLWLVGMQILPVPRETIPEQSMVLKMVGKVHSTPSFFLLQHRFQEQQLWFSNLLSLILHLIQMWGPCL